MAKYSPKFNLGDMVVSPDGMVGEILSFNVSPDGISYKVSSAVASVAQNKMVDGVRHMAEKELKAHKEKKQ